MQLVQKNCITGDREEVFPKTTIDSVVDRVTGETLEELLKKCNHLYLPFKDNSKALTRCQVPTNMRRRGLWITYVSCKGNVVTEWYNSDDFSSKAWGDNNNWIPYLDESLLKKLLKKLLAWYIG